MDSPNVNDKLLEIIRERNLIPKGILDSLISSVKGKELQEVLLEEGLISKEKLTDLLSEILGWKVLEGKEFKPDETALKVIPPFLVKFHNFIPLKLEERMLHVGFFPPVKATALEDIRLLTGLSVEPYLLKIVDKESSEGISEKEKITSKSSISTPSMISEANVAETKVKEETKIGIETINDIEISKLVEELTPEGGLLDKLKGEEIKEEITEEMISKSVEEMQKEGIEEINVKEESITDVLSELEGIGIVEEIKEETKEESIQQEVKEEIKHEEKEDKKKEKDLANKIIESIKSSLTTTEKKTVRKTSTPAKRKPLGEILLEKNLITKEQLDEALMLATKKGIRLGEALLELKLLNDIDLAKLLSEQLGIPFKSIKEIKVDHDLAKLISAKKARERLILPLYKDNGRIIVGIVDPANIIDLDDLKMVTKNEVVPVIVPRNELIDTINQIWGSEEVEKVLEEIIVQREEEETQYQEVSLEEVSSEEGPIAKLVNSILVDAVKRGASDIHIEPLERNVRVRFRIDGVLHEMMYIQKKFQAAVVSRIKIMSDMDISERRIPQDGRIKANIKGEVYDFRVSTLPGVFGEKVVLRILGRGAISLSLESLGFSEDNYERYLKMLKTPYGIILVTGPTGSGKSTTLYASLNMINSPDINIVTVEDPVEYQLPGIHQVQVNPKAGLTFASALRSILRQDPDVVLVGEIRDEETARIAIQAALTGHLVLSTLHTNDAPSAVTRLIDMGIEPFLISSSLLGAVAQRLVRTVCPYCKAPYEPTKEEIEAIKATLGDIDLSNATFYKGQGCPRCNNKGYKGRTAIHEIMLMNDEIRDLVLKKASRETIKEAARKYGMVTLREDGMRKVLRGFTTVEEVMRVTAAD
jgi:type IV pilus assembly protein PilB